MFKRTLAVVCAVIGCSAATMAQSGPEKFEAGAQFSYFHQGSDRNLLFAPGEGALPGAGLRFTYNPSKWIGVEAETNFLSDVSRSTGGNKWQGLFGPKAGYRWSTMGLFAKARPGFVRYSNLAQCDTFGPFQQCGFGGSTRPALDLGGVAEFYPSSKTTFRVDVGDTMIRLREPGLVVPALGPPLLVPGTPLVVIQESSSRTRHNFQMSIGAGFRF